MMTLVTTNKCLKQEVDIYTTSLIKWLFLNLVEGGLSYADLIMESTNLLFTKIC